MRVFLTMLADTGGMLQLTSQLLSSLEHEASLSMGSACATPHPRSKTEARAVQLPRSHEGTKHRGHTLVHAQSSMPATTTTILTQTMGPRVLSLEGNLRQSQARQTLGRAKSKKDSSEQQSRRKARHLVGRLGGTRRLGEPSQSERQTQESAHASI